MLPAAPNLMLGLWKREGVKPAPTAAGGSEIAFAAADEAELDRLFAEWRAGGVAIALRPTKMDFGYTFFGLDPTVIGCASLRRPIDRRKRGNARPRSDQRPSNSAVER